MLSSDASSSVVKEAESKRAEVEGNERDVLPWMDVEGDEVVGVLMSSGAGVSLILTGCGGGRERGRGRVVVVTVIGGEGGVRVSDAAGDGANDDDEEQEEEGGAGCVADALERV